jgi:hypothetical protein
LFVQDLKIGYAAAIKGNRKAHEGSLCNVIELVNLLPEGGQGKDQQKYPGQAD